MDQMVASLREVVEVENPWDDTRFESEFKAIALLDSVKERNERLEVINREIGRSNVERIEASDGVFAILDGVDVDSGTAAEIGYGYAKGKIVSGLRTDFRLAGDNEGAIVNLQVQYFIEESGGRIVTTAHDFVDLARSLMTSDR